MDVKFEIEDSFNVVAKTKGGARIEAQSVQALLMLAMLEKLEEIRCGIIDVENEINQR